MADDDAAVGWLVGSGSFTEDKPAHSPNEPISRIHLQLTNPSFVSLPGYKMQQATRSLRTIRPGFFKRQLSPIKSRSVWTPGPSPPRLPKEEQEMFEKLQQQSTGAFSTPRQLDSTAESTASNADSSKSSNVDQMLEQLREKARVVAKGDGEELHPHIRRGAKPEFEGDVNPKTGEVGGPKNEPVRWGPSGDWSYNGRVSDF